MSLPVYPIWIVNLLGSSLMILFSFLSLHLAKRLKSQDQNNVIWTYLVWLCYGLALFAISRSVGHIVKRFLLSTDHKQLWDALRPYSGAMNTLSFMVVASITLFFERIWKVYQQILRDKHFLQETHEKLLFLNRNLEDLVAERTRELRVSERKYRRIFEVSRDMIAVVKGGDTIVALNPAGANLLGLPGYQIPKEARFSDFLDKPDSWSNLQNTLQRQGYIADTELRMKRHNGTQLSALLSGAAERDSEGTIDTIHFLIKDISQRKAMEQQLLQADKLASIGQLAAGIAHEINNPLAMILGYTQLLLRTENKETQRYADLKIVEKHARNCKTIVEDLLSFSRSTPTRQEIGHLHKAMEDVLSVVQHHFALDDIRIEKQFDTQIPEMILDLEKIKQVFMNLIMNAKQAIGKKGLIQLQTAYDNLGQRVLVKVMDSGCGIEPQNLPRIFDPFFTTKPTGEGTGLGLSVSYGIVQNHGGQILVESELEVGTTFTVVLPIAGEEAVPK